MPRNTSGGSGHKSQRNSEGSKARNNRCLVDAYLEDIRDDASTKGVSVGRVLKRMGCGRMQVLVDGREQIIPMRGGLRGRAKKTVWVDIDSLVLIAETGLGGTTHEIVGVFSETHIAYYKKLVDNADPRLFQKSGGGEQKDDDLFEAVQEDDDEDVEIDKI